MSTGIVNTGTLKMPRLGETMEQGRIIAWLVTPGQAFERGDALVEVETDKTLVEFPALGPGTLTKTLVDEGEMVSVGAPIAMVETGTGPDWTIEADTPDAPPDTVPPAKDRPAPIDPPARSSDNAPVGRPRATPPARRHARSSGIDIAGLAGTGRRGRVERVDVERALGAAPTDRNVVLRRNGITYQEQGPADGVPVLLLHGFGADHTIWSGLIAGLVRSGAHSFAPDMPAHGATAANAKRPGDLADGLTPFAHSVFDAEAPHLIAHSLGALPAVALVGRLPLRSLTLIAPVGLGGPLDEEFVTGLAQAGSKDEVSHLLGRMTNGPTPLSASAISRIHHTLEQRRLTDLAAALVGPAEQPADIRAELALLARRLPVRIIVGHRDRIIGWSNAMTVSPRIALHHLPECGHMPQWEALPEVLGILKMAIEPGRGT